MDVVATDIGFRPGDAAFVADPYPTYERLRRHSPIVYDPATDHWLVTRHEDVNALLRDRRRSLQDLGLTRLQTHVRGDGA